jgi:hypothetical protein
LSGGQDTSVSSLWTPSGEHEPKPEGQPAADDATEEAPAAQPELDEETREQVRRLREQLARTPVADIIANHAIGIWELALLHLSGEEGRQPDLAAAGLALDGLGALVEGLGERLGEHERPLRDALAQLRLAYVEVSRRAGQTGAD